MIQTSEPENIINFNIFNFWDNICHSVFKLNITIYQIIARGVILGGCYLKDNKYLSNARKFCLSEIYQKSFRL